MAFYIKPFGRESLGRYDYAGSQDINQYFGMERQQRVPPEFEGRMYLPLVDGRTVLATYLKGHVSSNGWRGKTAKHRCYCNCPDCTKLVPVGRTHQHKCKVTKG